MNFSSAKLRVNSHKCKTFFSYFLLNEVTELKYGYIWFKRIERTSFLWSLWLGRWDFCSKLNRRKNFCFKLSKRKKHNWFKRIQRTSFMWSQWLERWDFCFKLSKRKRHNWFKRIERTSFMWSLWHGR